MSYYTIKGCYRLRSAAAAAAVHAPLRENPGKTRDSFLFPAGTVSYFRPAAAAWNAVGKRRIHNTAVKMGARTFPPPLQGSSGWGALPRVPLRFTLGYDSCRRFAAQG